MKLDGLITISRITNTVGEGCIQIAIEDKISGIRFVEASVSFTEFAQCIAGLGMRPASLEVMGLDYIGCEQERKSMDIFVPNHDYKDGDAVAKKAVSDAEKDGWTGYVADAQNGHRIVSRNDDGAIYKVSFHRWIKEKP